MIETRFDPTSLPAKFLNNKKIVEDAVRATGFETYTILRPAAFMANWLAPKVAMYRGLVETGIFTTALRPDTVIPYVDEYDVAAFSLAAFKDPVRFHRQEIGVASATYKTEEIMNILSKATGRQIKADYWSDEDIATKAKDDIFLQSQVGSRTMAEYFNMDDIANWGIPLHTFEEFLEREKASLEQTYSRIQ